MSFFCGMTKCKNSQSSKNCNIASTNAIQPMNVYTLNARANLPHRYFPFCKSPPLLTEHKKGRKPLRSGNRQTAFSNRQTSLPHLSQKKSEEQNNFISILRICFQFVEPGWLFSIWTTINGRRSKSWSSFLRPCWTKHNSLRFPICWFLPQNPFVRFLIPKTWSLIFPVHIFLFSISTFVPLDCLFY